MAVEGSGTAAAAATSKFGPKKPGPPSSSNLPTWLKRDSPQDPSHVALESDSHDSIRPRRGSPATASGPGVPPRAMNRRYPLTCAAGAFRDRLTWKEQERSFLALCDVQHPAGNGYGGNGYGDAARFHLSPRPVRQWWWPGRAEGPLHPDSLGRAGSNAGRFNRSRAPHHHPTLIGGWCRRMKLTSFGPTTPTRARRLADALVDPTEARNDILGSLSESDRSARCRRPSPGRSRRPPRWESRKENE
jgi:hypothetical protein